MIANVLLFTSYRGNHNTDKQTEKIMFKKIIFFNVSKNSKHKEEEKKMKNLVESNTLITLEVMLVREIAPALCRSRRVYQLKI